MPANDVVPRASRPPGSRTRFVLDGVVFACCLALTVVASLLVRHASNARDELRFANAVSAAEDRILARLDTYLSMLRATAGTMAVHPHLTKDEFHRYVSSLELERRYPGIQGIGFSRRLAPGERGAFEAEMRAQGQEGFHVWPDHPREELHTIAMLEPLDRRNAAAIGYDMFSEPVRRQAMSAARDTGQPRMTGLVTLVQEIEADKQPGFLIYQPLYAQDEGAAVTVPEGERQTRLLGFVYAPFRAGDLFSGVFGGEHRPRVAFRVYDGHEAAPPRLLHEASDPAGQYPSAPEWTTTRHLEVAGQPWTLTYASLPEFERVSAGPSARFTLLAGLLLSLGVLLVMRTRSRAQALAARDASELEASLAEGRLTQLRLAEEKRISEALQRIGVLAAAELDRDRLVQLITDEATRLCGADFGAFFHNVQGPAGDSYLMYALSGVPREHFARFPNPRATSLFGPTFRGERVIRLDDVTKAPEYGRNAPYHGMPEGHLPVRSYLAVPVISRAGAVLGGLFFGHAAAARFTKAHEALAVGIAANAAVALENAELYRKLQDTDRRKDEFLAMLAHELRNPLAPVATAVQLLRLKLPAGTKVDSELSVIDRQLRHLMRLVDDLLDVSRITRGKISLQTQRLDLTELVRHAAATQVPAATQRGLELALELPAGPLWVDADPVRIEQVVTNLLNNAVKYTNSGGRIVARARSEGEQVVVEVQDNGTGIPPDVLPRIFEAFEQGERGPDRSQGGLGIGLTLVRRLIELHGGQVGAASEGAGRGTTLTFRLPRRAAPPAAAPAPPAPAPPVAQTAARRSVLVVDDNVDAAELLHDLIELLGYGVEVAADGPGALARAEALRPAVIFLDIGLPGLSGHEVARLIRQSQALKGCVLVALTGYGQPSDRELSRAAGFDHHLVKPASLDDVRAILAAIPPDRDPGAGDPTPSATSPK